jgi:hypothetical protein
VSGDEIIKCGNYQGVVALLDHLKTQVPLSMIFAIISTAAWFIFSVANAITVTLDAGNASSSVVFGSTNTEQLGMPSSSWIT